MYWLFDAMGAKDLEWRTGGKGSGAADGGRDLEAHFYTPTADDELEPQVWWIECKGRSGTVEKSEIQEAVLNAQSRGDLDYLVIATNTQFSNPTRDWVKEWQGQHKRPKVKLWDHAHLERLLSKHPDVVLRLFSEALSLQGQAQAMETRFWNKLEYTPVGSLENLWAARKECEFTAMGMFAAVTNEFYNGDICKRSWGACLDEDDLIEVLQMGLMNVPYLVMRSFKTGADQEPVIRAISYLIMCCLEFYTAEGMAKIIDQCLFRGDRADMPDNVKEVLLMPIMDRMLSEMQELCSEDCSRISSFRDNAFTKGGDEIETYWQRFDEKDFSEKGEEKGRYLLIERQDAPCEMGFKVNKDSGCPLFGTEPEIENVEALLKIIQHVAHIRKGLAMEKLSKSG